MNYLLLKQVHVSFALLSITGFVLRWAWVMKRSRWSQHRLTKTTPHIIDTLFLASGLMLAYTIEQYPFLTDWLTAKVVGLLAYILLGMAAMSGRISRTGKVIAFVAAVSSYAWILSVAMLKSPWGFLVIV
jgi:uncharacterized membrane protein SirB2